MSGKLGRWLWPRWESAPTGRATQVYVAYHALAMQLRTVKAEYASARTEGTS